ncbi:hypothetical protein OHC33_007875 [Knufia fluminis]|uniref:Major facilitator superfamily (MFS) profile domain-containing protein n=1 Tax=Knufia fluminis TaxID=191047 RepID=A0AAN8I2E7_9EURO|nr:hypothetical protein OHC33_007875 [Knufia fluminis]
MSQVPMPKYQDIQDAPATISHEERIPETSPTSSSPTSTTSSTNTEEIEHLYLNFDTQIATRPVFPDNATKDYPPCPNLKEYDDPFTWSKTRKNLMTWVSCATNMTAAYSAGSYAAPEAQLTELWGVSRVAYNVGITVFTIGFGIAPMVLAPFSEINGRRPVFVATGILFVAMQLACALTNSYAGMLVSRFVAGIGGSTFSTMVGGILADIWVSSERNTPMVLFTGATLFGTGLGPLVSGFVAQRLLWRWVFYIQVMTSGTLVTLVTIFFKETRGPILLSRKAKALNNWYAKLESLGAIGMEIPTPSSPSSEKPQSHSTKTRRIRYKVLATEQRPTLPQMIRLSLTRPAHLLLTEPVVICFSLWISFSWAILYLQFGAIPLVYETNHNFTLEQTGAVFTAVCVGGILSTVLSIYQDKWAVRRFGRRFTASPEGRLWFTCAEASLMPIGMFWFGFSCYASVHWIVPTLALVAVTMGIFSIFLATFNYTADVYQTYASSALAASGVCRNFLGGSFPLVTVQMFNGMGFQAASSLLGGIGIVLSLGPILLIWFGPRIRLKSKVARQFVRREEVEE